MNRVGSQRSEIEAETADIEEQIGFLSIEIKGTKKWSANFLVRYLCIHEQAPIWDGCLLSESDVHSSMCVGTRSRYSTEFLYCGELSQTNF